MLMRWGRRTKVHTVTRVTSEISFWPVRYRIEKFGISRVPKSGEKVRTDPRHSSLDIC
jgi:hypothetical protein